MTDLNKEYKKIIDELDRNISNPEDLEYAKNQMYKLSMMFIDEMEAMTAKYEDRISALAQNQAKLEEKMKSIQKVVNTIEKDIYDGDVDSEEDTYDFQIICPYCNHEFVVEMDDMKEEVTCPECKNIIELEWDGHEEVEGCSGSCHHCHGCEEMDNDDEENSSEEDDM